MLPRKIEHWSLTSLQKRLVKTSGRLLKHAWYWLLLAESHLTRRRFWAMNRIVAFEIRHFLVFYHRDEPSLARSCAAGVAREAQAKRAAPMVMFGCIIDTVQDAIMESLDTPMEASWELIENPEHSGGMSCLCQRELVRFARSAGPTQPDVFSRGTGTTATGVLCAAGSVVFISPIQGPR